MRFSERRAPFPLFILFGFILFGGGSKLWAAKNDANDLRQTLSRYHLKPNEVGGVTLDLQSGKVLVQNRADTLMVPASLSKIVTALAVLDQPETLQLKTRVLGTAAIETGELHGDLILEGGGDPAFVSESMADLVDQLQMKGLVHVDGNVIIDDSRFDSERYDEHRESKRVDRAYDAPIGALSFDWNAVSIYVRPGSHSGDPAQVVLDPDNGTLQLINRATTASEGAVSISASRVTKQANDRKTSDQKKNNQSGDQIVVSGRIPLGSPEKVIYKSISQPDAWTGSSFLLALKRAGIQVDGRVKIGIDPHQKKELLVELPALPTGELVLSMMKFSNNFIAEMLTKNLAANVSPPGTMKNGIRILQQWLQKRNLSGSGWTFVNPSGLTNENRLSATQLSQLLTYAYQDLRIYPEFVSSLPIAGKDGTLKHRGHALAGRIRAKTGLLKDYGAAALAGYATTPGGKTRAFAWIVNEPHQIRNLQSVWDFLDKMAEIAATGAE